MALVAENVGVAGTGAVYFADSGTSLPTSADDFLGVAWEDHGYISQDGVAEAIDETTTNVVAWQNSDVVRKLKTEQDVTYAFAGLESSARMLETYYGNYNAGAIEIKSDNTVRGCWVLDFIDGDNLHVRVAIPDGEVTARGGVTRNAQGAFEYPVTITCYPDSDGVKAYMYVDTTPVSSD